MSSVLDKPGLQYPGHLEESNPTDAALKNVYDNLFYLRRLAENPVVEVPTVTSQVQNIVKNLISSGASSGSTSTGIPIVIDTHNTRLTLYATPSDETWYFEIDRKILYVSSNYTGLWTWVFVAGVMEDIFANRPTDLGVNDVGFVFYATDATQKTEYIWTGSTYITVGGVIQSLADAVTNAVSVVHELVHLTSGAAANGFGLRRLDQLQNNVAAQVDAAAQDTVFTNVAAGAETSSWTLLLRNAGAALANYFSVLVTGIKFNVGGLFGILVHANTADRTYTLPDATGNLTYQTAVLTNNNFLVGGGGALVKDGLFSVVPVANGGTGANTAAGARAQLNAAQIQAPGGPHTITLAKITGGGANGNITFNAEGVVTGFVDPT